jgi:hypothetical protein
MTTTENGPESTELKKNNNDIDYMHYKAVGSRSKAAVLKEKIKVDDISAKEIDFSEVITDKIINIQSLCLMPLWPVRHS